MVKLAQRYAIFNSWKNNTRIINRRQWNIFY
nr:MAG TPA: hypothetical protein [Bacteriophage sp.]